MTVFRIRPRPGTAQPGDPELVVDPATTEAAAVEPNGSAGAFAHQDGRGHRPAWVGQDRPATADGLRVVEVVVGGWRFELEVEDDVRVSLRRRATRDRDASNASGPLEIRAIIPGRVAAVRVAGGDDVEAGAGLLVVEAMKMQNELRAPRAGTVERVAVAAGDTIELGDLLLVLR